MAGGCPYCCGGAPGRAPPKLGAPGPGPADMGMLGLGPPAQQKPGLLRLVLLALVCHPCASGQLT